MNFKRNSPTEVTPDSRWTHGMFVRANGGAREGLVFVGWAVVVQAVEEPPVEEPPVEGEEPAPGGGNTGGREPATPGTPGASAAADRDHVTAVEPMFWVDRKVRSLSSIEAAGIYTFDRFAR